MTGLAALLTACGDPRAVDGPPGDDDGVAAHTGATTETAAPPPRPAVAGMTCAERPQRPLQWDCVLDRRRPGAVTVTWTSAGETFTATTEGDAVTLWGLAPAADVAWTLSEGGAATASGAFVTAGLALPLAIATTGTSTADHVLLNATCGGTVWVLLASTDGTVRWFAPSANQTSGYAFAEPDTVLMSVSRDTVFEVPLGGTPRQYGPWPRPIHHDLGRDPLTGYVVTFNAEGLTWTDGRDWVFDGLYGLDDGAIAWTWDLVDHVDAIEPTGKVTTFWDAEFPGAGDFAHGNNLSFTPDGDLLLSFRYLDAVWRIAGPGRADAGAVRWVLTGSGSTVPSDWTRWSQVDGQVADFDGQHHPTLHPDGTLTLFDNGPDGANSRALTFALDEPRRMATLIDVIDVGVHCGVLGSTYRTADGGALVTCADRMFAREHAPGTHAVRWEARVTCGDTPTFNVNHVIPVELSAFVGSAAR